MHTIRMAWLVALVAIFVGCGRDEDRALLAASSRQATAATPNAATTGNNFDGRIASLETAVAALQSSVTALQAGLATAQSDLAATKASLGETQTALVATQTELATTKTSLAMAQTDLTALQTTVNAPFTGLSWQINMIYTHLNWIEPDLDTAKNEIAALSVRTNAIEKSSAMKLNPYLTVLSGGRPKAQFSGINLQIVNGAGSTATSNGTGNVIIGYDGEGGSGPMCSDGTFDQATCEAKGGFWGDRAGGSHNLVVGSANNYLRYGSVVAGFENTSGGAYASVCGGRGNVAGGQYSSVSGGSYNRAQAPNASVSGGATNDALGNASSISGGSGNEARGDAASISGGDSNIASGAYTSISGGWHNTASGQWSSISGGDRNAASGQLTSILGGVERVADVPSLTIPDVGAATP